MNERITAGASAVMGALFTGTFVSRWFVGPTAAPEVSSAVLDESTLRDLLTDGAVEANGFEYCPAEERTTFHALRSDGSRRCWTCQTITPGGTP